MLGILFSVIGGLLSDQTKTFRSSKMGSGLQTSGLQTNWLKHAWGHNRIRTSATFVTRRTAAAGNNAAVGTFCTPRHSSRLTAALAVPASAEQAELMLSSDRCIGSASTNGVQGGDVDLLESATTADRLGTPATASNSETPSPSGAKGELPNLRSNHPSKFAVVLKRSIFP